LSKRSGGKCRKYPTDDKQVNYLELEIIKLISLEINVIKLLHYSNIVSRDN